MDLGIKGKTALVCAASKGLGRGCAEALAAEGVNLVINARGEAALIQTAYAIAERHPDVDAAVVHLGGTRVLLHTVTMDDVQGVDALRRLVTRGEAELPAYDISSSRAVGTTHLRLPVGRLVVAEGIFAAETIGRLREAGILHSAWCVRRNPWVTFVLRLVRDLSERRKPPHVLLRRGLALCRAEPQVVARMEALGATCATPREAEAALAELTAADTPERRDLAMGRVQSARAMREAAGAA